MHVKPGQNSGGCNVSFGILDGFRHGDGIAAVCRDHSAALDGGGDGSCLDSDCGGCVEGNILRRAVGRVGERIAAGDARCGVFLFTVRAQFDASGCDGAVCPDGSFNCKHADGQRERRADAYALAAAVRVLRVDRRVRINRLEGGVHRRVRVGHEEDEGRLRRGRLLADDLLRLSLIRIGQGVERIARARADDDIDLLAFLGCG